MSLRLAASGDIPRLIEIRRGVEENRLSAPAAVAAGDYAPFIAASCCWVWEEEGRIQGFSALDLERRSLWALFVQSRAHGGGVGRALLDAALARARRVGLNALHLTTAPGTRAERFYRAAGWQETGSAEKGDVAFRLIL